MDKYLIPGLLSAILVILTGGYSKLDTVSNQLQTFEVLISQRVTTVEVKLEEHLKSNREPSRDRLSYLPKAMIKPNEPNIN